MTHDQAERLLEYIDLRIRDLIEAAKPLEPRPFGWRPKERIYPSDNLRTPMITVLTEKP